jgi:deoxyribonuclease-4
MRWGCHLNIGEHTLVETIQHILDVGGSAVQIFVSPNRGTGPGRVITKSEADMVRTILKNTGVYLVIHGKYILNFCDPNVSWYHDALVNDIKKAHQLGDRVGVVIHQGKNKPDFKQSRSDAIKTFVKHLEKVLEETKEMENPIVLENSCQQGNEIGYTIEELAEIYHTFAPKYQDRVRFCLDTCHIFVAGSLQFKDATEVDAFMERFDKLIGVNKLEVIHFNDSKTPFNAKNDHHHDLGEGYITSSTYESDVKKYQNLTGELRGTKEGLKRLVNWAKRFDIPLILETPLESVEREDQVKMLGDWVAGEVVSGGGGGGGGSTSKDDGLLAKPKLIFKKKSSCCD